MMDKPIPKEVMVEAMRALMCPEYEMVESVSRALLARDERAADKAYGQAAKCQELSATAKITGDNAGMYRHNTAFHAASDIATAILTYDGASNAE